MDECFDTEHFIELIRERPALWNVQIEEYSNKILKQQYWNDVFVLMVNDFNELPEEEKIMKSKEIQRRWKSLRNSFSRELAKQKQYKSGEGASSRKTYVYFEMLSFLKPTHNNSATSSLDPEVESQDPEENIPQESFPPRDRGQKRPNKLFDAEENLKRLNESSRESLRSRLSRDDDDKLFLLSLHSHLKTVPKNNKLSAKAELIQVLAKYNDTLQFCSDGPSHSYPSPSTASTSATHHQPHHQYYHRNMHHQYPQHSPEYMPMVECTALPSPSHSPDPSDEESSIISILSNNESL